MAWGNGIVSIWDWKLFFLIKQILKRGYDEFFYKFENQMKHFSPCRWGWSRGESVPTTTEGTENLNIYTAGK